MSVTGKTRPSTQPLRHAPMLIAGSWMDSASGDTLDVESRANRQKIADISRPAVDVDGAVQPATLSDCKVPPRPVAAAHCGSIGDRQRAAYAGTRPEAQLSADIFRYFGGLASELKGDSHYGLAAYVWTHDIGSAL